MLTEAEAKSWAGELGIKVPAFTQAQAPDAWQAWADRVFLTGVSIVGRTDAEHAALVADANRYA